MAMAHRENERRPELFSYTEVVFPHHREKVLIGTPGYEVKVGTGVTRGFHFGHPDRAGRRRVRGGPRPATSTSASTRSST